LADKDMHIFTGHGGGAVKSDRPRRSGENVPRGERQKHRRKKMSCFIMEENRIARLAADLVTHNQGPLQMQETGESYDSERLADAMLALNIDAFRQRYDMKMLFEDAESLDLDRHNWTPLEPFSPAQFLKTLQCFLYQCSEGDADQRPLFKNLDAIKEALRLNVNEESAEYEAALWG
jgi:hypothetical protein